MGDPERGRTIFEGIIDTHAKRLDLWNVYIDMETAQEDIQRIRQEFSAFYTERLIDWSTGAFVNEQSH